jgi:hypothetical protein
VTRTPLNASLHLGVSQVLRELLGALRTHVFRERALNDTSVFFRHQALRELHRPANDSHPYPAFVAAMEARHTLTVFKDPNLMLNEFSALNFPAGVAVHRHSLWRTLEQLTRCVPENPSVVVAKESVKAN